MERSCSPPKLPAEVWSPGEEDSTCQAGRWQLGGNCTVGQPGRREPEGRVIPAQRVHLSAAIRLLFAEEEALREQGIPLLLLGNELPIFSCQRWKNWVAAGVGDFRVGREMEEFLVDILWSFALPQPRLRAFLRVENLRWIRQGEEKIFIKDGW